MATFGSAHGLSRRQQAALSALMSQPTMALAAREAKVGERTLYRWLQQDSAFQEQYRLARRDLVQHAIASVQKGTEMAAALLRTVILDAKAPVPSRVTAAKVLLEFGLRAVELEQLEARIAALEQAQKAGSL